MITGAGVHVVVGVALQPQRSDVGIGALLEHCVDVLGERIDVTIAVDIDISPLLPAQGSRVAVVAAAEDGGRNDARELGGGVLGAARGGACRCTQAALLHGGALGGGGDVGHPVLSVRGACCGGGGHLRGV